MPFAVAYQHAGIKRHEFDVYVRLLAKRGIDWTSTQRIPEPGTENRWLYVWDDRDQAGDFCQEIRKETRDDNWYVRELAADTEVSSGPLMPVVIHLVRQSLGSTFKLHPHSRAAIHRRFPEATQVSSVYVEHGTQFDFEQQHGPMWDHIAMVLTGLSTEQLVELGGYRILEPGAEKVIHHSPAVAVT